MILILTVDY